MLDEDVADGATAAMAKAARHQTLCRAHSTLGG